MWIFSLQIIQIYIRELIKIRIYKYIYNIFVIVLIIREINNIY